MLRRTSEENNPDIAASPSAAQVGLPKESLEHLNEALEGLKDLAPWRADC